jgi:hypothetical protein
MENFIHRLDKHYLLNDIHEVIDNNSKKITILFSNNYILDWLG